MKKSTGGVMSLNFSSFYSLLAVASILFLTPACQKETYKSQSFNRFTTSSAQAPEKKVEVSVRPLTQAETKSLFNGRGNRLLRKHKQIYPLFLTIKNYSDHAYIIDPKNINLPLAKPSLIASRLYSHTARRIVATMIIGTVGTAMTLFGGFYLIILGAIPAAGMPALIKAGYVTLGLSGLIAVGTPTVGYQQGASAYTYNCSLEQDVMAHTLVEPLVIDAHHELSCLLFVSRRSYRTRFSITLVDQTQANPLSFDIEVPKGGVS